MNTDMIHLFLSSCQDWDFIAEQLGTRRSGYQCFCQYKSDSVETTKQRWTIEEDKLLMAVVEKLRVGDFVPWDKVVFSHRFFFFFLG